MVRHSLLFRIVGHAPNLKIAKPNGKPEDSSVSLAVWESGSLAGLPRRVKPFQDPYHIHAYRFDSVTALHDKEGGAMQCP